MIQPKNMSHEVSSSQRLLQDSHMNLTEQQYRQILHENAILNQKNQYLEKRA